MSIRHNLPLYSNILFTFYDYKKKIPSLPFFIICFVSCPIGPAIYSTSLSPSNEWFANKLEKTDIGILNYIYYYVVAVLQPVILSTMMALPIYFTANGFGNNKLFTWTKAILNLKISPRKQAYPV